MGFENRDYAREEPQYQDSYSRGGGGGFTNPFGGMGIVTKRILIVTGVVFLLQSFVRYDIKGTNLTASHITDWLELSLPHLMQGQIWRLVTYAFCHAVNNPFHLLFNMFLFWMFGKTLETMYGAREYLFFYLTAAVAAGIAFIGLEFALSNTSFKIHASVIGASGGVMAIMILYACHFPRQKVNIWGIFPIEIRWLITGLILYDLFPVIGTLAGKGNSDGVAHSAHLGGVLFGYLYYRFQWRLSSLIGNWKVPDISRTLGSRRKIKIYSPPANVSDSSEIDALLEKISKEGMESLTKKERKTLEKASKKANRRMNQ